MSERIYLLPRWIRLWHWTNAVLILVLGVTGFGLHFASTSYELIEFSLAVRIHNIAGLALTGLFLFFIVANAASGNWRQYVPRSPGVVRRCWVQTRYYVWGVFKGEPEPFPVTRETNFNALQSVIYWLIMYVVLPLSIITGLLYLTPQYSPPRIFGFDGHLTVAMLHYLSAAIIVLFAIAHIYLGSMGAKISSMYRTMITGWHEHE